MYVSHICGLNLQIEHHLFPGLSHSVLRTLTPVIQETCREFNIPFKFPRIEWPLYHSRQQGEVTLRECQDMAQEVNAGMPPSARADGFYIEIH
ncbi:delta-4 fatty acid desaturase [Nannochloropsis gaditana]|uniref:Delta-4 fatty acid desaturase n=1 Tax=Nannochloropsis gaditana TaxID=72520 RepID=W7TA17_9STRA|nr:delta-4 fatty acid desaturase [Nannochloropsis gaditana]